MGIREFPVLAALGLKAVGTKGYGDCQFNALSDQIYGDESHFAEIRAKVVNEMRQHPDDYKYFIPYNEGGGYRRNARRRGNDRDLNSDSPSPAQIDNNFKEYLARMSQKGEYGDNLTIQAFSSAYKYQVFVYTLTNAIDPIGPSNPKFRAYLALDGEHYSSVRNTNGPLKGVPKIKLHNDNTDNIDTTANTDNIDNAVESSSDSQYSSSPATPQSISPLSSRGSLLVKELQLESDSEDEIRGPNRRHERLMKKTSREKNLSEENKGVIPTIEIHQPVPKKFKFDSEDELFEDVGDSSSGYDSSSRSSPAIAASPQPLAPGITHNELYNSLKGVKRRHCPSKDSSKNSQEARPLQKRNESTSPTRITDRRTVDSNRVTKRLSKDRKRSRTPEINRTSSPSMDEILRVDNMAMK